MSFINWKKIYWALVHFRTLVTLRRVRVRVRVGLELRLGLELAKQSACIALYYRNTWNVVERTAYI